jgi:hypothetical protein
MTTYEIDITKRVMKTIHVTVPDHIPAKDVREWAYEYIDELHDVSAWQGEVTVDGYDYSFWDHVPITMKAALSDEEYELEGVTERI